MSFQVSSSPPLEVGSGTITNAGDQTVYYRDELPVSSSVNDGSLAPAASVTVTGSAWVVAGAGTRSAVTFTPASQPESAQSGSGLSAPAVTTVAASGASQTLTAPDTGGEAAYDVTLTADCTFTLAGGLDGKVAYLTVLLRQGGSGSYAATWLGSIAWPYQTPPLLSTAVGAADLITLFTFDGGATWNGAQAIHAIQQPSAPAAPTGLAGVVTDDVPNLGWNAPTNNGGAAITGYKVYRGTSSGTETLLATIGNVTVYADDSAVAATAYWYKVAAVNAIGTGSQSNEITLGGGPTTFAEMSSPAAGLLTDVTAEVGGPITMHPASTGTTAVVTAAHRVRSNDNTNETYYIFAATPPSADYTVSADITRLTTSMFGYAGVFARADPTVQTYYIMRFADAGSTGQWELYRYVAGTPVSLATPVTAADVHDVAERIDLQVAGSTITGFVDGVQIFNVTDATITAAGKVGIEFYENPGSDSTGTQLSNFLAAA